jgi:hypothetical protein
MDKKLYKITITVE